MHKRTPFRNPLKFLKAVASNQFAKWAPKTYIRYTGETGRGLGPESVNEIADYFRTCFRDYFTEMGVPPAAIEGFLAGKCCLEYGPGDVPGVALLMYAHGADKVWCVDRFPLVNLSTRNIAVLSALVDALPEKHRERARTAFVRPGDPVSGFNPEKIEYLVRPSGLSGLQSEIDFLFSRAVLEHVDDLRATFADMERALKPAALGIHQVDLRSHGLHSQNPLDFLTWSDSIWRLMYSEKGVPNRYRLDRYREVLQATSLTTERLRPLERLEPDIVSQVRPYLATPFRLVGDDDLAVMTFWLIVRKPQRTA